MSLLIHAKHSDNIGVSYRSFELYKVAIVSAMEPHIGELYGIWVEKGLAGYDENDTASFDEWFAQRPAVSNLCGAPSCGFSFTPRECREIRRALEEGLPDNFEFRCADRCAPTRPADGSRGYVLYDMDLHARLMEMLGTCAKKRVKMFGE